MELGFSAYRSRSFHSSTLDFSNLLNLISNHILNLACTIADSGAVGIILWTFEAREIISDCLDGMIGSRLHAHISSTEFLERSIPEHDVGFLFPVADLLFSAVTGVRISKSRLLNNFSCSVDTFSDRAVSGVLATSVGIDEPGNSMSNISDHVTVGNFVGESFSRHLIRTRQIAGWICTTNLRSSTSVIFYILR